MEVTMKGVFFRDILLKAMVYNEITREISSYFVI